jgi:hypothetical protein
VNDYTGRQLSSSLYGYPWKGIRLGECEVARFRLPSDGSDMPRCLLR